MPSQGLTPFALVFMLVSMGAVTVLMVYCFWRILREPGSGGLPGPDAGGGAASGGAGTGGGATGAGAGGSGGAGGGRGGSS